MQYCILRRTSGQGTYKERKLIATDWETAKRDVLTGWVFRDGDMIIGYAGQSISSPDTGYKKAYLRIIDDGAREIKYLVEL